MKKQLEPFWFVWCEEREVPKYKHSSLDSALKESRRLARLNRDLTFIVLQSVCAAFVCDVETVDMTPCELDQIPF